MDEIQIAFVLLISRRTMQNQVGAGINTQLSNLRLGGGGGSQEEAGGGGGRNQSSHDFFLILDRVGNFA